MHVFITARVYIYTLDNSIIFYPITIHVYTCTIIIYKVLVMSYQ